MVPYPQRQQKDGAIVLGQQVVLGNGNDCSDNKRARRRPDEDTCSGCNGLMGRDVSREYEDQSIVVST